MGKPVYYIAKTRDGTPIKHDVVIPTDSLLFQYRRAWYKPGPRFMEFKRAYMCSNMLRTWSFIRDSVGKPGVDWFVMQGVTDGVVRLHPEHEKRCRVVTAFDYTWCQSAAAFMRKVVNNRHPVHFINVYIPGLEEHYVAFGETLRSVFGQNARIVRVINTYTCRVTPHTLTTLLLAIPDAFSIDGIHTVWTYDPSKLTLTEMPVEQFIADA